MNYNMLEDKRDIKNSRKVDVLHIVYWAIIFALLSVFLLVIAPGRINEDALDTVSFASALISIVLAVVSIVYSLQTGKYTSDNVSALKNIEYDIIDKVSSLESVRDDIKKYFDEKVLPIGEDVSNLKDAQADVNKKLDQLDSKIAGSQSEKPREEKQNNKKDRFLAKYNSVLGNLALYAAGMAYKSGKPIDECVFDVLKDTIYIYGFYVALSCLSSGVFQYEGESAFGNKVTAFDENFFGSLDELRKTLLSKSTDISEIPEAVKRIDNYYRGDKASTNDEPSDENK